MNMPLDLIFYNEGKGQRPGFAQERGRVPSPFLGKAAAALRSDSMSKFWQHFITDGAGSDPMPSSRPAPSEEEALDAFSRVVVNVAEAARPAVVNLRAGRGRMEGSGSGVLFTPDGFLLTNHHVIHGSRKVRIRLTDGRELDGRIVGTDPWTDLAV